MPMPTQPAKAWPSGRTTLPARTRTTPTAFSASPPRALLPAEPAPRSPGTVWPRATITFRKPSAWVHPFGRTAAWDSSRRTVLRPRALSPMPMRRCGFIASRRFVRSRREPSQEHPVGEQTTVNGSDQIPAEIDLIWKAAPSRIPAPQHNMIPPSAEQPPLNPKGFRFAPRGCDVPRRRVLPPPSLLEGLRAFDGGSAVAAGHYSALHLRTP